MHEIKGAPENVRSFLCNHASVMTTTVYIGHIGEDEQHAVLAEASKYGQVISSTVPRRSKSAHRIRYPGTDKVGLDPGYAYYMFVTMDTVHSDKAILSVHSDGWECDPTGIGAIGGPLPVGPVMYAAWAKK
jgi:hypothetical protein